MKRPVAPIPGCLLVCVAFLSSCGTVGSSTTLPGGVTSATGPACDRATQWSPPAGNIQLNDVAMVSPDEGWAVGNTAPLSLGAPGSASPAGVIYHFLDGQWTRLPETYANSPLVALSMDSPTDGWAFSAPVESPIGQVVVLHYTLGQWRRVDIPALDKIANTGGFYSSVSLQMFGPNAGWMFAWVGGSQRDPSNPNSGSVVIIMRYENGVWVPIAAPPVTITTEMFALSAVSANEAWITGTDYDHGGSLTTIFAHYLNGVWSLWSKTFAGNVDQSITMLSPSDGWAAYMPNNSTQIALLHYNGTAWTPVATPAQWSSLRVLPSRLVFALNSNVTWFGAMMERAGSVPTPLLEQYAQGQWKQVAWPFPTVTPQALAAVSGSGSEIWGVGNVLHQEGCAPAMVTNIEQGVFLHFQQGQWSGQMLP